jgi:hypothetical protein
MSDAAALARLKADILRYKFRMAVIDPAYLCFDLGDSAGNIFKVGKALAPITRIGRETGCVIMILHHFRKSAANRPMTEDAQREDMSQSGWAEWARQWMLVSRREVYNHDGEHRLKVEMCGAAGHGDRYAVDISEGKWPNRDKWEVKVETMHDVEVAMAKHKEQTKHWEELEKDNKMLLELLTALKNYGTLTINSLSETYMGAGVPKVIRIGNLAISAKLVEATTVKGKNGKPALAYKLLPAGEEWKVEHEGENSL